MRKVEICVRDDREELKETVDRKGFMDLWIYGFRLSHGSDPPTRSCTAKCFSAIICRN
jgi:hypothetical protein